jgi:hypothetical protein
MTKLEQEDLGAHYFFASATLAEGEEGEEEQGGLEDRPLSRHGKLLRLRTRSQE